MDEAILAIQARVKVLEDAIRKHRDATGHEMCWLNDDELYAVLPPEDHPPVRVLPPLPEFMEGCARYWQCQSRREEAQAAKMVDIVKITGRVTHRNRTPKRVAFEIFVEDRGTWRVFVSADDTNAFLLARTLNLDDVVSVEGINEWHDVGSGPLMYLRPTKLGIVAPAPE